MTTFTFTTAGSIRFGNGRSRELGDAVKELGSRALLVTGSHPERVAHLTEGLPVVAQIQVGHEPEMGDARRGMRAAEENQVDVVIAIGGGSVLDLAKAVAVLAANGGDPLDYAEVIGDAKPLVQPGLPVIALPTTSGTGAEVTANAVMYSPEHRVKVSLRSATMLPRIVIVDPELTIDCPASVTASSGLDALTQCVEPLTSHMANPMTDGFALEGLRRASKGLRQAFLDGSDRKAREDMAVSSLMGGLSLANAKLGAVHGFAGVLGGLTGAPHGKICGALLAHCSRHNLDVMKRRDRHNPAIERYSWAGQALTGTASAEAAIEWIDETVSILQVGTLTDLGLKPQDYDAALDGAERASSMKGNPIKLTRDELAAILADAC